MTNVLIIEPTGALCINPHLAAFVRLLCNNAFSVDIISTESDFPQNWSYQNSKLVLCKRGSLKDNIFPLKQLRNKYDLIIGVDQSIIAASSIADQMDIPFGFISYEILFADEIGDGSKALEINACKNVSFAISQDNVRAYLVSKEYRIPREKILCMPVSDEFGDDVPHSELLKKHFNISDDRKIVLFTGAVTKRSMIDELIEQVKYWSDKWVLVLHSYSTISESLIQIYKKQYDTSRIYFSDLRINGIHDLLAMIASADVGVCLFTPDSRSVYQRKNTLFMGLSSGKFAMYLKAGLPVIINEVGEMSDMVREYNIGIVIQNKAEIDPSFLDVLDASKVRKRCKTVYQKYFDFDLYSKRLLQIVKQSLETEPKAGIRADDELRYTLPNLSYINQLTYRFNEVHQVTNSKFYIAGKNVYNVNVFISFLYQKFKSYIKRLFHLDLERKHYVLEFNDNLVTFYRSNGPAGL